MWWNVIMSVLSITAFLGGLQVMRQGLEGMGQGKLNDVLTRFVQTPTRGILTGTLVTAVMQSSAAVTAITVGMVASGSMVFRDALGVVLGANVGSTVTPQLLTLNLWAIVIPCLLAGALFFLTGSPRLRSPGMALVGFATIFIALQVLSTALHPLAQTMWFRDILAQAGRSPLVAVLTGCAASSLIQSSTATTVITMALAEQGLIPLHGAIAIILGANVGSCLTSVVAAIGQSKAAQQVALSHVLLNVAGVVLFLPFLAPFTDFIIRISAGTAQQIANAHTIFNLACTLMVWPITQYFANVVERLLPDHRSA